VIHGRSTRAASFCSGLSWKAPRASPIAKRSSPCRELGFAEIGSGDLGLSLGYVTVPRNPYPREMRQARERVFAACCKHHVAFLETATPESIIVKLNEGSGLLPAIVKKRRLLGAPTKKGRCRCKIVGGGPESRDHRSGFVR
jgi:hypothetical protein